MENPSEIGTRIQISEQTNWGHILYIAIYGTLVSTNLAKLDNGNENGNRMQTKCTKSTKQTNPIWL